MTSCYLPFIPSATATTALVPGGAGLGHFHGFSEGNIHINGERDFDLIQLDKRGADLIFLVNGQEVWRTTRYRLLSNRFAFWVADFSDAVMKSYTVQQ